MTYQLTSLTILPLLVSQNGRATLLGSNALGLLERGAEGPSRDLAVLVEAITTVKMGRKRRH